MRTHFLTLVAAAAALIPAMAQEPPPAPPAETDLSARSKALEIAGAFSNDGYKMRDGYWSGEIEPGKGRFLEVNLFAGNEYWFSAAATPPARKLSVAVFNEKGKPVAVETYEDGPAAAAGFIPEVSGRYFVRVLLLDGEKSQFCLLYSYK
ncbi:MAG TPA: hypothetical protein PLS03_06105 [Terrimicrobiaceae bacterium]|nr:hypothetical protein [Terrimicrobiaceae bacterium]